MNKKLIRLTKSDLHRIVRESVSNVLTELLTHLKLKMLLDNLQKEHQTERFI